MTGTIGILCSELSRYTLFWAHLLATAFPQNIKVIVKIGGANLAASRNELVKEMIGDWLWMMDDDHTFDPHLLQALLDRDVPIVQPLVLKKQVPYDPVFLLDKHPEDMTWEVGALEPGAKGLRPCTAVGTGGMLVRREVFSALEPPYFRVGQVNPEVLSEDVDFCLRAKAAGFQAYVDFDNVMGHLTTALVVPQRLPDGRWGIRLVVGGHGFTLVEDKAPSIIAPKGGQIWTP